MQYRGLQANVWIMVSIDQAHPEPQLGPGKAYSWAPYRNLIPTETSRQLLTGKTRRHKVAYKSGGALTMASTEHEPNGSLGAEPQRGSEPLVRWSGCCGYSEMPRRRRVKRMDDWENS